MFIVIEHLKILNVTIINKTYPIINKSDSILFFYLDYVHIFVKEN